MSDRRFGYAFQLEPRDEIALRGAPVYRAWREAVDDLGVFTPPAERDPREWFDMHDQGQMNGCQGNSLADAVDFCYYLETGEETNTSRAFAYLESQREDGLLGSDGGSTLDGGTKAAARGLPLEQTFPYSDNYRTILSKYKSERAAIVSDESSLCKTLGEVPLTTEEDCFKFLSTGSGVIQIGILWGLPDAWEITSYRAGGGGHAVLIPGYLKVDGWPGQRGYLLKNSWGPSWGQDGWAIVHPKAITQMLAAQFAVFIGRSAPKAPKPKIEVDL